MFTNKQQATWECKNDEKDLYGNIVYVHRGYGIVQPVYVESLDKYRRGSCMCEKEAREQYFQARRQGEFATQLARLRKNTFGWLGEQWEELEMTRKTFYNFEEERQPEALQMIRYFLDDLVSGSQHGHLILHGPYGTGKTHLLAGLCNALHEHNRDCLFASSVNLFSAISDSIGRNEPHTPLLRRAISTPLLVLDDIDKAKTSDFRQEIYFAIIDGRTKKGLPTAISTNRLAELECFVGGPVFSRLKSGRITIEMTGSDYRAEL